MQPETFLRRVLWLDAATCTGMAVLLLAGGGLLEPLLGLPRALHIMAGLLLIPCASLMAVAASRRPLSAHIIGLAVHCTLAMAILKAPSPTSDSGTEWRWTRTRSRSSTPRALC